MTDLSLVRKNFDKLMKYYEDGDISIQILQGNDLADWAKLLRLKKKIKNEIVLPLIDKLNENEIDKINSAFDELEKLATKSGTSGVLALLCSETETNDLIDRTQKSDETTEENDNE